MSKAQILQYHNKEKEISIDLTMVIKMAKGAIFFIGFGISVLGVMALLPVPTKKIDKPIIPQNVQTVVQSAVNTLQRAEIKLGGVQEARNNYILK